MRVLSKNSNGRKRRPQKSSRAVHVFHLRSGLSQRSTTIHSKLAPVIEGILVTPVRPTWRVPTAVLSSHKEEPTTTKQADRGRLNVLFLHSNRSARGQFRSDDGALQNAQWMAKCEDLELQCRTVPEGSEKRGQKSGQ